MLGVDIDRIDGGDWNYILNDDTLIRLAIYLIADPATMCNYQKQLVNKFKPEMLIIARV